MPTTRFYFPASEAAAVNPAYSGGWVSTAEAGRYRMVATKGSSAIAIGTRIGPWNPQLSEQPVLDRMYVSDPMTAGVVFDGTTSVTMQLAVREFDDLDDVNEVYTYVSVCTQNGTYIQDIVAFEASVNGSTSTEFINNATCRNKTCMNVTTETYTTVAGDRLVLEVGYSAAAVTGVTSEAAAKWGENATDLPVNETTTTDGAGWIEFSNTITFLSTGPGNTLRPMKVIY